MNITVLYCHFQISTITLIEATVNEICPVYEHLSQTESSIKVAYNKFYAKI